MKFLKIILLSTPLLLLNACIDQNTADAKMEKGCRAGVQSLIGNRQILEIQSLDAATKDFDGEGKHRFITMNVLEKDGWVEYDTNYHCVFLEQWGMFKSSHDALLMQIKIGDEIYGKSKGKIVGDWDDFVNIGRTVDAAMGQ